MFRFPCQAYGKKGMQAREGGECERAACIPRTKGLIAVSLTGFECLVSCCGGFLQCCGAGMGGGPGPLEVEAAQMAGYIDDLADEEEAGHAAGLHAGGAEFPGVNAT